MERTILVVEDDTKLLLALRKHLTHAGFEVLTAVDGPQALECARERRVDAISLDVNLRGDLNGLEVAELLQRDPRTSRIPIIFITGSADESFREARAAAGGRYFISKPYDSDLLIQVIRGIFAGDELAEVKRLSSAKRRQPV